MGKKDVVELPEPVLTVRGDFGDDLHNLVTERLAIIARHAREPVLAIRVGLDRHHDPAVDLPVAASVNIDVNGRKVHAAATGRNAREAVNRMAERLIRQLDDRPPAWQCR